MPFLPASKFVPSGCSNVFGIDEVGRGPWAGPVVGCVLAFKPGVNLYGIDDSKKLSAEERENLFEKITKNTWFGIGIVDNHEIDKLGLRKATNESFIRAIKDLGAKHGAPEPDFLLVDGRDRLQLPYKFKTIIKGDAKVKIIAAASIVAKVTRDRLMTDMADKYPEYGFESHKGYGTEHHQKAIRQFGLCEIHRKSFKPIADLFQSTLF